MEDKDFLLKLREDMLQTRQRRIQYQLAKVTSIGSLIGIGVLLVDKLESTMIFYVIPFIAIAFDLFILGESFALRRMASFVHWYKESHDDAESSWERYVKNNPDRLSSIANFSLTLACLVGSISILVFKRDSQPPWFAEKWNWIWLFTVSVALFVVVRVEWWIRTKRWRKPAQDVEAAPNNSFNRSAS